MRIICRIYRGNAVDYVPALAEFKTVSSCNPGFLLNSVTDKEMYSVKFNMQNPEQFIVCPDQLVGILKLQGANSNITKKNWHSVFICCLKS